MSEQQHNFFRLRKKRNIPADELPKGYDGNSSASYYNEASALALKKELDKLDATTKIANLQIPVTKYKSVHTIYQQVYLGWRYLIERMDTPDKKYTDLRKQLSIRKRRHCVEVYWNMRACPTLGGVELVLNGVEVENTNSILSWQESMMEWSNTAKDGAVDEKKIDLSQDEIQWLHAFFATSDDVVIIRANHAGYKITKNAALARAISEERGE